MLRRKMLKRKASIKTRKPIKKVNTVRKAREFARAYHSRARVLFVQNIGCAVCGQGPCHNAHTKSKSGMGRKGDYNTIAALCASCHVKYDTGSSTPFQVLMIERDPQEIEAAWQQVAGAAQ